MSDFAVQLHQLTVTFNHQATLEDIDLDIQRGSYVGILGPNGAGKSTLLKVILGIIKPTTGSVQVFGASPQQVRRQGQVTGYLPQRPLGQPHFPISVLDVVLMGRYSLQGALKRPRPEDREAARHCLALMGIVHLQDRIIGELSGGEQQRVFIARALVGQPRLLILDEPTISLDACAQDELYELIHRLQEELGLTVIMVSHDIGAVSRHVDDIVCLNRRVYVHQRPPLGRLGLEQTFGCSVEYLFHGEIPHRVVRLHDD